MFAVVDFSAIIKHKSFMKKLIFFLLLIGTVLVQSCIVKSLHPFYLEDDVVMDTKLSGSWVDADGRKWNIQSSKEVPKAYEMSFTKDGQSGTFLVHLFKLEGSLFLDFSPFVIDCNGYNLFNFHLLPSHSVAKIIKKHDDQITIRWFNEEWLNKLFTQNRIKISHEELVDENSGNDEDKTYVLTASTQELRKFLIKYGNDNTVFEGDNTFELVLRKSI
jgi:hypothetical protein